MNSSITIGMDMGDKSHQVCVLDGEGIEIRSESIPNTKQGVNRLFKRFGGALVAMEAGTHSGWVSRELEGIGCRVLIGNPRKLRAIWMNTQKSDVRDAEMLARIARVDPKLLYPIHHRGEEAQMALETIKARDMLVRTRADLINHVRAAVKGVGGRLPGSSTEAFHHKAAAGIPEGLRDALTPLMAVIEGLTNQIRGYDKAIEKLSVEQFPETLLLTQVKGVGPITSLAFVLTLEEPGRFSDSRAVGAYFGLTQRRDQSGQTDKQLRISRAGNGLIRRLLVSSAQFILGPLGEDCDLRRYGLRIAAKGGKSAKGRAVVAVARKLAVLLHVLWITKAVYEPLRSAAGKETV